jgi:hypothetical protein
MMCDSNNGMDFSWIKYFFNFKYLIFIVFVGLIFYTIFFGKRKKYRFLGYKDEDLDGLDKDITTKKKRINKKEEMCRSIFQKIFNVPFPSVRPSFLKNPATGKNLEIDGYNEQLKLGFEYDGEQHAMYNTYFHSNERDFIYQTKKDQWKTMRCKELGIKLVRIPHTISILDLESYIRKEVSRLGY